MKAREDGEARAYRGPDSGAVQRMFAAIAHRYDFLNHFLSLSTDKQWRRIAVDKVADLRLPSVAPVCIDLCTGTGDLAIAVHRRLGVTVIASDFCHPMLQRAAAKIRTVGFETGIQAVGADALALPFPEASFDVATMAFGLRNLEDPARGLLEVRRILKPGGAAIILEFSKPVVPVFRQVFNFYFRNVLPQLGAAISGDKAAYRYLPDSVAMFPSQDELAGLMRLAGFADVAYRNLYGGIAALHWGVNRW